MLSQALTPSLRVAGTARGPPAGSERERRERLSARSHVDTTKCHGVTHRNTVAQITLRLPDSLLDRVEAATGPETSRSEWLRDAAREKLDREDREDLEQRVDRLEGQIQRLQRPLWKRVLDRL